MPRPAPHASESVVRNTRTLAASIALAIAGTLCGGVVDDCPGLDLSGNGFVDGADLAVVLGNWGTDGLGDVNEDGIIDGADLAIILGTWGQPSTQPGTFPDVWIFGGPGCAVDPPIQVHWYNDDFCILRQSLCTNFEAPFMYLLFGENKVLMQDTGAGGIQIKNKAFEVITAWATAKGLGANPPLVVSHSHAHGDHVAGDSQFNGQPGVTLVGLSQTAVRNFFGITTWPTQIVQYDLGNRILDVIPIPGHQTAHIAIYDRRTGILFTGDTLYPGRLYISDFGAYRLSINRMVTFVADKPLCHVLGTHIEMTNVPQVDFPIGSTYHPNEHPLRLGREHLLELAAAIVAMSGDPHYEKHDSFIIYPLNPVAPPPGGEGGIAGGENGEAVDPPCCERPKTIFDLKRRVRWGPAGPPTAVKRAEPPVERAPTSAAAQ